MTRCGQPISGDMMMDPPCTLDEGHQGPCVNGPTGPAFPPPRPEDPKAKRARQRAAVAAVVDREDLLLMLVYNWLFDARRRLRFTRAGKPDRRLCEARTVIALAEALEEPDLLKPPGVGP